MTEVVQTTEPKDDSLRGVLAEALAAARAKASPEPVVAETEPEAEPETVEVEAQTEGEETAEVEETTVETELPEGPTWLPKEDRDLFAQAPENVRTAWERNFKANQANYTRATQELKEKTERVSRFDQALAPVSHVIRAYGLTETQAINYLVNQWTLAQTNPQGFMDQFAKSVGLSPGTSNATGFDTGLDDPRVRQIQQELGQLKQTLFQGQRQQALAEEKRITTELSEFANAKGADGNPAHPHFERVQSAMVPFVSSGLSLAQAYEKAVRADDELFEQLVTERSRKALQKPAVKKVTSKPKASGSGITQPKTVADMSLREELSMHLHKARASS